MTLRSAVAILMGGFCLAAAAGSFIAAGGRATAMCILVSVCACFWRDAMWSLSGERRADE